MKKFLVLFAILAMTVVSNASLTDYVVDLDWDNDNFAIGDYHSVTVSDGPIFTIDIAGIGEFEGFCVEPGVLNYQIGSAYGTYTVTDVFATIQSSKILLPSGGSKDFMTDEAKIISDLYFDNQVNANDAQAGIWYFQTVGTLPTYPVSLPSGSELLANYTPGQYVIVNVWVELDGVTNNMVDDPSKLYDSQSFGVKVPAPGAVLLSGFGTALIGLVRRRSL